MRRALVTGGTRGIGRAIARRLAEAGHDVIVTYGHDEETARATELAARADGLALRAERCDVTSSQDWHQLFARGTLLGDEGVTILVHAAGFTRDGLLMTMPEEEFDAVVDVHLKGAFLAAKAVLRGMIAARTGRMVFITSPTAALGRRGQTNYGAAKAGLAGLMRSLLREVSRFQITVNCVCAGLVETTLTQGISPEVQRELLRSVPLGRMGRPEDVAAAVAWLASESSGYVTGITLSVDGGLS